MSKEDGKVKVRKFGNESGYGAVIVVVLIFILFSLVVGSIAGSIRFTQSQENLNVREKEKWDARAALATVKRILEVRIPKQYSDDIETARNCFRSFGGSINHQINSFDEQDLPLETSNPILIVQRDGSINCQEPRDRSGGMGEFTSLLGNSDSWAERWKPIWQQEAYTYGYSANTVNIASLKEVVRRYSNNGSEPVYEFGFIIDVRGGQHYRDRAQGEVFVGGIAQNCGATGRLSINPLGVRRGDPITFSITFTNAQRLRIYDRSGVLLHDATVRESENPEVYEWIYVPGATNQYRVEALSSKEGCFSRSGFIEVTVTDDPPGVCPVIDSFIASAEEVFVGDPVTLSWSVRDAAEVTLEGNVVAPVDSAGFVMIAERTFTLSANDAGNLCRTARQLTVRVRPRPACSAPTVTRFEINPSTTSPGAQVELRWEVTNLQDGGVVRITEPNGNNITVGATGSLMVTAPGTAGAYNYTIVAYNACNPGLTSTMQTQLIVESSSCNAPNIESYTANPTTVVAGGNQTIRFLWNVNGTTDSISINNNVGTNLPASGTVSIPQPQITTRYRLTATGCGQSRVAEVEIVVYTNPEPPSTLCTPIERNVLSVATNPVLDYKSHVYNVSKQVVWNGVLINISLSVYHSKQTVVSFPSNFERDQRCFSGFVASSQSEYVQIEYIKLMPLEGSLNPIATEPLVYEPLILRNVSKNLRIATANYETVAVFDVTWAYANTFVVKGNVAGQTFYEVIPIYTYSLGNGNPTTGYVHAPGVTGYSYSYELYVDTNNTVQQRYVVLGDY